jgi:hypothetical protein
MGRNRRTVGEHAYPEGEEPPRSYRVDVEALNQTPKEFTKPNLRHKLVSIVEQHFCMKKVYFVISKEAVKLSFRIYLLPRKGQTS